jgi:hypothetical protein
MVGVAPLTLGPPPVLADRTVRVVALGGLGGVRCGDNVVR